MLYLKIGVCDDNDLVLERLHKLINNNFKKLDCDFDILSFNNANRLVESNCIDNFDIVFLDIDMPELNGIDAATYIKYQSRDIIIIFVTNKDDLVFDSLKAQPFRFLRKSKLDSEISESIMDAYKLLVEKAYSINIKIENKLYEIDTNSILYIESDRNNIIINTINRKQFKYRDSIKKKEEELSDYGFIRVHEGYLVNQRYIHSIKNNFVILKDKIQIPVSRSRKQYTQQKILEYLR